MDSSSLGAQQFHPVQENVPLPDRVAEQLRTMVLNGALRPGERLSNEPELAHALGVSRSTLRAALDRLTHDGLILRRRGIGTFVAGLPRLGENLNTNFGSTQHIRASGAVPGTAELHVEEAPATDRVAECLQLSPDAPVVAIERVRTANGHPVMFSREFVPLALLRAHNCADSPDQISHYLAVKQSLYEFLGQFPALAIHSGVADLQPAQADQLLSERLHTPVGKLLMYIQQVDYTVQGKPVLLSDEYWIADAFSFSVLRSV